MRTKAVVRKHIVFMLLVLVIICISACQPTPEQPVVVNRSEEKLEKLIEQTSAPAQQYETPDRWTEILQEDGKYTSVHIDAEIIMPDVQQFPVVEIQPVRFTQSEVDELIVYFTNGAPLYDSDIPLTKVQYQEMLIQAKAELTIADNPDNDLPPKEHIEEYIKELEKQIQTAPETVTYEPIDGKLKIEDGMDYETIEAFLHLGNEKPARIRVSNMSETHLRSSFCFDNGPLYGLCEGAEEQEMTSDEAISRAEATLRELEIDDMHAVFVIAGCGIVDNFSPINSNLKGYRITCRRFVEGIPVLGVELPPKELMAEEPNMQYAPMWSDGRIEICLNENEITSFRWLNRGKIGDVLNENVMLLPFEEIQQRFKQQMSVQYVDGYMYECYECVDGEDVRMEAIIDVDSIQLGLATVRQKDKPGKFVLIPVWALYGMFHADKMHGVTDYYEGRSSVLMCINAIDGSIMHSDSGY